MPRILRDENADPTLLSGAPIGVVGFGNQGAAQALCLRDSGLDVRVFTRRDGPSDRRARAAGFSPAADEAIAECAALVLLVPDEVQPAVLEGLIHPRAEPGALLVFAHGFALRHGGALPRRDLDVVLVGPLGPGELLRRRYQEETGLAGLFAVVQDASGKARDRGLAYAAALGLTRAGLFPTTLEEEVVSDLFAEQAVLCGGVPELLRAAWETLVRAGVGEDVAYYSLVAELKQILDVVAAEGPSGMRERTSRTAQYGGLTRGRRLVGEAVRQELQRILDEVRDGRFAREWIAERGHGETALSRLREEEAAHPLEEAGRRVRAALGTQDRSGGVDSPRDAT